MEKIHHDNNKPTKSPHKNVLQRQPLASSHQQTGAQPGSEQQLPWKNCPCSSFTQSMTLHGMEYILAQFEIPPVYPQALVPPQRNSQDGMTNSLRNRESTDAVQSCDSEWHDIKAH